MPWAGPMSAHPLSGAVVAVVGATGALGSRIARGAASRGAELVLVGRDGERLRQVVAGASVLVGDLSDVTLGERLVATALDRHGQLDGVVNAAGVVAFGALVDTDDTVLEEVFLTNVIGPLWLLRRVAPALGTSKGFVAQLSAVVAEQPLPGMAAYAASKAALTAANRALARELRRSGIDVLDVRPPHTETGLAGRAIAGTAPRLPKGLDPDDVARRVLDAIEEGRSELASTDFA
jgi:short-subunit dehydrogenase